MNAIVEAFAFDEKKKGGVNLDSAAGAYDKYLQCACVSLASLKRQNPDDEVVFATNMEIPASYRALLDGNGVSTRVVPFDDFVYPDDMQWGLAYYKLCALKNIVSGGSYDNVLLCDTDVWCQRPLTTFWKEVSGGGIFMIDLHSSLESDDRQGMMRDANRLFGGGFEGAACWGGEVIAGRTADLAGFLGNLNATYRLTLEKEIFSPRGDEFLVYASQNNGPAIRPANAYGRRLWTGRYFTPARHEGLALLHLPAEKDHAFEKAYRKLERGSLPANLTFLKWSGLAASKRPLSLVWVAERCWSKLKSKFA